MSTAHGVRQANDFTCRAAIEPPRAAIETPEQDRPVGLTGTCGQHRYPIWADPLSVVECSDDQAPRISTKARSSRVSCGLREGGVRPAPRCAAKANVCR